jgi:hypothetical protein
MFQISWQVFIFYNVLEDKKKSAVVTILDTLFDDIR